MLHLRPFRVAPKDTQAYQLLGHESWLQRLHRSLDHVLVFLKNPNPDNV